MKIDLYGIGFDTPCATFHLWTPWRASALEHRLFEAVRTLPRLEVEESSEGVRLQVNDPKTWKLAVQGIERVMKGWQEEADAGAERRSWCWLLEGDVNPDGYDHFGEPAGVWALLRVAVERGGPDDDEKTEDIDLEGFSLRIESSTNGEA